ncbi:hypothetical protein [Pyrolobus fumarii]|uniref:hypothetical protein n=1 Tax=Pyrolobus fumarii TaxID=54252 RepID=UPI0014334608|nr:hypothetical protein [Pyrolobus fumarii]
MKGTRLTPRLQPSLLEYTGPKTMGSTRELHAPRGLGCTGWVYERLIGLTRRHAKHRAINAYRVLMVVREACQLLPVKGVWRCVYRSPSLRV